MKTWSLERASYAIAVTGACLVLALPKYAHAQGAPQPLPGLVVTVPGAEAPSPEAQPVRPPASRPDKGAKAKAAGQGAKERSASLAPSGEGKGSRSGQSIVVLVNDDPITAYEIEQRARLISLSTNNTERVQESFKRLVQQDSTNQRLREILQETIQANPGKSREHVLAIFEQRKKQFAEGLQRQALESARASALPSLKKTALEELIEERLKLQEAKRINASIDDNQVNEVIRNIAQRNKMTPEQFAQHMKSMGGDIDAMKARFRATLSWNEVVRRRFSALVSVNSARLTRWSRTQRAVTMRLSFNCIA